MIVSRKIWTRFKFGEPNFEVENEQMNDHELTEVGTLVDYIKQKEQYKKGSI